MLFRSVSARVDSVEIESVSGSLSAAEIYLGTDTGGPLIADVQFQTNQSVSVDRSRTSVTGAVKVGASETFGQFSVDDSGSGVVRAVVYYRVEVEGV